MTRDMVSVQLSKQKVDAAAALKVDKGSLGIRVGDYITGDGTTSDTVGFQAAIDACESTGQELILNASHIKIDGPIYLPIAMTWRGVARANGGVFTSSGIVRNCIIETYVDGTVFLPKGTSPQVTRLTIQGVEFANKMSPIATYGATSILFGSGITLFGASIKRCTTSQYGTVFAGKIQGVSDISENYFMTIWTALTANDIYDSRINHNYISGQVLANPTGITVTASTGYARFVGNFIEFMKYGIKWTGGSAVGNIIAHNQFDYCYRGLGTVSVGIGGNLITDNIFHACKSASALSYFTNPDTAMSTTDWVGIEATNGITNTRIGGNIFDTCDVGWKARGYPYLGFDSRGNRYKGVTTSCDYSVSFGGIPNEQTDIYIQELDRQAVGALPSASISSGSIVSFDRQILFHNGKVVFNDNGTWRGAGTIVPKAVQTLLANGAVTVDASAGDAVVTLQANATSSSITNPTADQVLRITFVQDGTGGRTVVWPTNCKFASATAPSDTTASRRTTVVFRYDSTATNWYELSRATAVG